MAGKNFLGDGHRDSEIRRDYWFAEGLGYRRSGGIGPAYASGLRNASPHGPCIHETRARWQFAADNSLQTTALVNEAYLRLVDIAGVHWKDRVHLFALSAQLMRRILVDAARARAAAKRGGQAQKVAHSSPVNLDEIADASSRRGNELIAVDDALTALAQIDARKARVIELRFFGGLRASSSWDGN
jgi:RNA polymerase sigma factor (TIGR02999 family)